MGSALTVIGGDPIPATSDQVLIPADFSLYAEAIAHKIIHWVEDEGERDSVYDSAAAPVWVASPTALWVKVSDGPSVWLTVWQDSGQITASVGNGFVNGTDFQLNGGYVRKTMNNFVSFSINVQRKTSTLSVSSAGNISGDPPMFTFPGDYVPVFQTAIIYGANVSDGYAEVLTSGICRLKSGTPSSSIAVDEVITVSGSFFTA
jgi:hypothetical protein